MMFTAYASVHYSLYADYEKYALLTPGTPEAAYQARYLVDPFDEDARLVRGELRSFVQGTPNGIPVEYSVLIVRAADGETFDLYLVDEDQIFLAAAPAVTLRNAYAAGVKLVENWKNYTHQSFNPEAGDPRFSSL